MKKLLLLFFALTLFNCSDDDSIEIDVITQDPFIGEWILYKRLFYNGATDNWDSNDNLDDSILIDKQIYNEDGTMVAQRWFRGVLTEQETWNWKRETDPEYDLSITRGTVTYKMYADTYCSDSILKIAFSPTLREFWRKPEYDVSQCDEVVYENE
jgi:hypothetical protein